MISPRITLVAVESLTSTVCGTPVSSFVKWIWNGTSAVTVISVWSKAVLELAEISTTAAAGPDGAAEAPGDPLGAAEAGADTASTQQAGYGVDPGAGS
jgi:hypothetical protein